MEQNIHHQEHDAFFVLVLKYEFRLYTASIILGYFLALLYFAIIRTPGKPKQALSQFL